MLNKPRTEYTIYPDIIWNYEALKNNNQAEPISVAVTVEMNGEDLGQRVRTFSVRSVNECLLGYVTNGTKFHDTGIFFAAYVNEENPMIDQLLREALNTRIVNRFLGYQNPAPGAVDKQVYALWNVLQKRKFRYSSVSNTSLSSNVVYSQRVRTFDDALESSPDQLCGSAVSCLLPCSVPSISNRFWYVLPVTCLWDTTPTIHIRI